MEWESKSDGELLGEFASTRAEEPFAELVRRHSPMVAGTCRRVMGSRSEVEDATQAVFLTLACKAHRLKAVGSLPGWLHRVAWCVATDARRAAARRRGHEQGAGKMTGETSDKEGLLEELRPVLDAALNRLPEKYRLPLILHHLEGFSQEEAAQKLGCKMSTFSMRLLKARDLLRVRLSKEGVSLTSAALPLLLADLGGTAPLSSAFAGSTAKAATWMISGQAGASQIAGGVKVLVAGALKTLFYAQLKVAAGIACLLAGLSISSIAAWQVSSHSKAQGSLPSWRLATSAESGLGVLPPSNAWPWLTSAIDIDDDRMPDFCVYVSAAGRGAPDPSATEGGGQWYSSTREGRFRSAPQLSKWNMGTFEGFWFDLNLDGRLDFLGGGGNRGRWFLNQGPADFVDLGTVGLGLPVDVDSNGEFLEFLSGNLEEFRDASEHNSDIWTINPSPRDLRGVPAARFSIQRLWDSDVLGLDSIAQAVSGSGAQVRWKIECIDLDGDDVNDLLLTRVASVRSRDRSPESAPLGRIYLGKKGSRPTLENRALGLPEGPGHAFIPYDLDRDGRMDLLDIWSGAIYFNRGRTGFQRGSQRLFPEGGAHGPGVPDIDAFAVDVANSGRPSIFFTYPRQSGSGAAPLVCGPDLNFTPVDPPPWVTVSGADLSQMTFGDFDEDGDLDVVALKEHKELQLYRNQGIEGNRWLAVHPRQQLPSNEAMGCKLWIYRAGCLGRTEDLLYYTQAYREPTRRRSPARVLHAGLGPVDKVDLRLRFPISGKVVELQGLETNQTLQIKEETE